MVTAACTTMKSSHRPVERVITCAGNGNAQGSSLSPRQADRFGLVEMYHYPIGAVSLEFPRGGRKLGESVESGRTSRTAEETGFVGAEARILGRVHPDTGLIESANDVVSVEVPPDCEPGQHRRRWNR